MSTSERRRRRDPRRERQALNMSNGRTRVLRGDAAGPTAIATPAAATARVEEQPSPRVIGSPAYLVAVVPDCTDGRLSAQDRDLIGVGRTLADAGGGAVCVVTFAEPKDDLGAAGADRVVRFEGPSFERCAADLRATALQVFVDCEDPRHVLFPESDSGGADLGRRLAAQLGEPAATHAWRVEPQRVTRRGRGSNRDISFATPRVVIVEKDVGDPVSDGRHEARPLPAPEVTATAALQDRGLLPFDPQTVALEEAEFIVSAGNGVRDWEAFQRLTQALGATQGGTRVVVDAGLLPRDRQVGATGAITTARGYVALGISGAPQHLQGITACEHVVAVNTDAGCDMMKRATLAVVGDVQAIMRALLAELQNEPKSVDKRKGT